MLVTAGGDFHPALRTNRHFIVKWRYVNLASTIDLIKAGDAKKKDCPDIEQSFHDTVTRGD
jgi:hypothetical protein